MRRYSGFVIVAAVAVLVVAAPGWAGDDTVLINPTRVLMPTAFAVTPPMSEMPVVEPPPQELAPREIPNRPVQELPVLPGRDPSGDPPRGDGLISTVGDSYAPAPLVAFDGLSNDDNAAIVGFQLAPPDTQGAIGLNHYVQWVNLVWAVWDTSGNLLGGPWAGNSVWQALPAGSACRDSNNGDPITLYDHQADRWFMSQFALPGPYYTCLAVSVTGDPLGAWYVWEYQYNPTVMNDYPKFGVWPDGYYMTVNEFGSAESATTVFDRTAMLAGDPSPSAQCFSIEGQQPAFPLPTNLGGGDPPPAGSPSYNIAFYDDAWGNPSDLIQICELSIDWATPANSAFTCPTEIDLTAAGLAFDSDLCGYSRDCIPQPDTGQRLDAMADRSMYPLQYRNLLSTLGYEVMVFTHSVDVDGGDWAGIRWYELRNDGSGWDVFQGGTFAPDSDNRWMGSAAVDSMGNLSIGYSISSSATYPSVGYTGRLQSDPPGVLQAETVLVAGGGAQGAVNRWGDYSAMHVAPDGCTFWYTGEYVAAPGGDWQWNTSVGAFEMPGCIPRPLGQIEGTVTDSSTGSPIAGAAVQVGTFTTQTQADGTYSMTVPENTYTVTASAFGFLPEVRPGVFVAGSSTTVEDFALVPAPTATISGTVTGSVHGWPLYARVDLHLPGSAPVLSTFADPWTGVYSVDLPYGTYDFEVNAELIGGYLAEMRTVVVSGPATEDFVLTNVGLGIDCYLDGGIVEDFEVPFPPLGWSTFETAGTGNVWARNDELGQPNNSGGTGYCAAAGHTDPAWTTELWSPVVLLPVTPAKGIRFASRFEDYAGNGDASFEISADGGSTWTQLYTTSVDDGAPQLHEFDISAYAGQSVIFRWIFVAAEGYKWFWHIDDVSTYELPPPLVPFFTEDFEAAFPPAGWTAVDNTPTPGSGMWDRNDVWNEPNRTGGTGYSVCVWPGSSNGLVWDTGLFSPPIDLTGLSGAQISFESNFQDYSGNGDAYLHITTDGGMTWNVLLYLTDADAGGTGGTGVPRTIDVSDYVGGPVAFRWKYTATASAAWGWHIDDVEVAEITPVPPEPVPTPICSPTDSALVAGFVTDCAIMDPVVGVSVTNDLGASATSVATPDDPNLADGFYYLFTELPGGSQTSTFTADAAGYGADVVDLPLTVDVAHAQDFELGLALLDVSSTMMTSRLYPGDANDIRTLSYLNSGCLDANIRVMAFDQTGWIPNAPMDEIEAANVPAGHDNDLDSRFVPHEPVPAEPFAGGDVIQSWPTGLVLPWGVGVNQLTDTIWVSNPGAGGGDDFLHEYYPDGTPTGAIIPTSAWMGSWAGDMAYDAINGTMWALAVGGDNCLHEIDLGALDVTGNTICWGAATSERGVAHDFVTDTFFVGGWNASAVTRVDRAGNVLQVANVGLAISGLAMNPSTGHLFVIVNADPNPVYVLDVNDSYNQVGVFSVTGFGGYAGAGLEFDCAGHLWATNQADGNMYEIDSGEVGTCPWLGASLPWVEVTPDAGVVPAAGQLDLDVEFMVDGAYHWGLHQATVSIMHDTVSPVSDVELCMTRAFLDVPPGYWADEFIHSVAGVGVTTGCGGGNFCPTDVIDRSIMARWLLLAKYGPGYGAPICQGIFDDVPCETTPNANYIEALCNEGITGGCSADPPLYCPYSAVTRAQMAVFLLVALEGQGYTPPACTGIFDDVPCTPTPHWAANWIEELYHRGITGGCSADPPLYCPDTEIPRDQMSVFMTVNWDFPRCGQ